MLKIMENKCRSVLEIKNEKKKSADAYKYCFCILEKVGSSNQTGIHQIYCFNFAYFIFEVCLQNIT